MTATNLAKEKSLKFEFQGAEMYPTGGWYIGLSTIVIPDDNSVISEPPSIYGYERKPITFSFDQNAMTHTAIINFGVASGNWGTIQEIFVASGSVIGAKNVWYHYKLDSSIPIVENSRFEIPAKAVKVSLYPLA